MTALISDRHAYIPGLVMAVGGVTSAFAVVLTGLRAAGASPVQAASGLAALCLTMGIATLLLATRYRIPITIAWSTPGAALLHRVRRPSEGGRQPSAPSSSPAP